MDPSSSLAGSSWASRGWECEIWSIESWDVGAKKMSFGFISVMAVFTLGLFMEAVLT